MVLPVWVAQWIIIHLLWSAILADGWDFGGWIQAVRSPEIVLTTLGATTTISFLQVVFLLPIRRPGAPNSVGKSLWFSLATAALAGSMLFLALVLAACTLIKLLVGFDASKTLAYPLFFAGAGACWLFMTPLLLAFAKRGRLESRLGRIATALFTGTMLEAAAAIPIDVMIRRKSDCHCAEGTFWTLSICFGVGLFSLGPAILAPILGKRRKRWYDGHCDICGYDMSGSMSAERCPECGAGWRNDRTPKGTQQS